MSHDRLLSTLGLCRKAGKLLIGFDAVAEQARAGGLPLIALAGDISAKTAKEMAYLANVYTLPEYRGRGIATRLIKEGVSELKGRGIGRILLHSSDMAKPLYEKLGFEAGSNYMVRKL